MLGILITMIERSWKNQIILVEFTQEVTTLFMGMKSDSNEYDEFMRISDKLYLLEEVNWDNFISEMKTQQSNLTSDDTGKEEMEKLIQQLGCDYGK